MDGLRKLYRGDFNTMEQEWQPDGSVVITLSKNGEDKVHRFRVRNLYQADEELVEDEVIQTTTPPWITARMKEAKGHERKG